MSAWLSLSTVPEIIYVDSRRRIAAKSFILRGKGIVTSHTKDTTASILNKTCCDPDLFHGPAFLIPLPPKEFPAPLAALLYFTRAVFSLPEDLDISSDFIA